MIDDNIDDVNDIDGNNDDSNDGDVATMTDAKYLLLLHVPYLSTLDDTATLHFSLSIAILVACSYRIPVHSLILSYQLVLGRPLPLVPSIYPSNNVLYTLFSRMLSMGMNIMYQFSSFLFTLCFSLIFHVHCLYCYTFFLLQ